MECSESVVSCGSVLLQWFCPGYSFGLGAGGSYYGIFVLNGPSFFALNVFHCSLLAFYAKQLSTYNEDIFHFDEKLKLIGCEDRSGCLLQKFYHLNSHHNLSFVLIVIAVG